jgi:hypothetical protein
MVSHDHFAGAYDGTVCRVIVGSYWYWIPGGADYAIPFHRAECKTRSCGPSFKTKKHTQKQTERFVGFEVYRYTRQIGGQDTEQVCTGRGYDSETLGLVGISGFG